MNKLEQIEHLKQSIQLQTNNEIKSMIINISPQNIFKTHLSSDYEIGVYDKLNKFEINDLLNEFTKQTEINVRVNFNSGDTF